MNYLATCDRFWGDAPGGGYRIAWDLVTLMRDHGHRAALLCGSMNTDPAPGKSVVDGVEVIRYRFPKRAALDPRRWHAHISAAATAFEQHAPGPWDVVHSHMPAGALAVFPRSGQARRLYTAHSPAVLEQDINWAHAGLAGRLKRLIGRPILRRSEASVLAAADIIHVLSDFTRQELQRLYGKALGAKVTKLPWWSCDVPGFHRDDARQELGLPLDAQVVFTIRRMVPRMGLQVLLSAAEQIVANHPRLMLVLAGDGPDRPALLAHAQCGPLGQRVRMPGRVSERERQLLYAASDLFVLPTLSLECFGIIALDALAAGLPVIASRTGAIPEVIPPSLQAYLFEPGDSGGLASLLRSFLAGELVVPPPHELTAFVRTRYSPERLRSHYLRLISACASQPQSSSDLLAH